MKLLSESYKSKKESRDGRKIFMQYFSPARLSGHEVCPNRTKACTEFCLNTAGMGVFKNVQAARVNRTKLYFDNFDIYLAQLVKEIAKLQIKHGKIAIRLNGTSDIDFFKRLEFKKLAAQFDDVIFYDYTKDLNRCIAYKRGEYPANYFLVFSERDNREEIFKALNHNISVVKIVWNEEDEFAYNHINNYSVIDGDLDDARWLDAHKTMIYLKPKGKARKFKN